MHYFAFAKWLQELADYAAKPMRFLCFSYLPFAVGATSKSIASHPRWPISHVWLHLGQKPGSESMAQTAAETKVQVQVQIRIHKTGGGQETSFP